MNVGSKIEKGGRKPKKTFKAYITTILNKKHVKMSLRASPLSHLTPMPACETKGTPNTSLT